MPGRRRVLIVSHDPLARRAIADLIARMPATAVAGSIEPTSLEAAEPADVAVWEATAEAADLRRMNDFRRSGVAVVALVSTGEQAHRARAMGAGGVLPRGVDAAALEAALQAVQEGLAVFDPALESPVAESMGAEEGAENLTPRELEVLGLIAEGLSNKGVAARLGIRESTVKDHVNSLLDKLGAQSRTEAVTAALRRGLIAI